MQLTVVAIPSLIALLAKCYFLFFVARKQKNDLKQVLFILLTTLFLLNFVEFLTFTIIGKNLLTLKIYYVLAILSLILFTVLVLQVTKISLVILNFVHSLGLAIAVLIFFSDLIIADVEILHSTITRVPGDFYFLFQLFAICELISCIYIICKKTFTLSERNNVIRARSSIILISLMPLLMSVLIIIFLMALGFRVNAVVIVPIATTIFLGGCIYACSNSRIIDFSILIPGTLSWRKKNKLLFFLYAGNDQINLQDKLLELEKLYIEDALKKNKGKITKAAKTLGYTPGKLDYRLKTIHQLDVK